MDGDKKNKFLTFLLLDQLMRDILNHNSIDKTGRDNSVICLIQYEDYV